MNDTLFSALLALAFCGLVGSLVIVGTWLETHGAADDLDHPA
jgi:hypothetical protein